jgi:hypothetical protein
MKLKLTPYSLLIAGLLVLFSSCSKKANVPVPADASMVLRIDAGSLSSKLGWEEIKQGELYKSMIKEVRDDFYRNLLEHPDSTGIDLQSDAYIFLNSRGRGGYACVTFSIKDEKAFTLFMSKTAEEGNDKIVKAGDLSVIKDRGNVVTWSSKRFVAIADVPDMGTTRKFGDDEDGYSSRRMSEDSLLKFARDIHEMKTSNSLGNNEKFASLISDKADMHVWLNTGKLTAGSNPYMSLIKANVLFEGNYTAMKVNFENGKIVMDSKSYYNKELAAFFKQHQAKNIDEEMLKKIPAGNVTGVFAMNYPPEGLKAFIKLLGVDGVVNDFLADLNITMDDFVKANKGDMVIAVSDFTYTEKERMMQFGDKSIPYKTTAPEAKVVFATSVNDKPAFEKLMTALRNKLNSSAGEMFRQEAGKIPYQLKDNWFVAGSDSGYINAFGSTSTNHPFISKISGHPRGAYVDIQKIISGMKPSLNDSIARVIADESAKVWQDIITYGGDFDDDVSTGHFEINMVDKNTNSLKQLHNYIAMIAKTMKDFENSRRAEWEAMKEMDMPKEESVEMAPPPAGR